MSIRILICGGRDYDRADVIDATLSIFGRARHIACIMTGGATGADLLALRWAHANRIPTEVYSADWEALGRKAGPIRNQRMIDHGKADVVIAFPGGRGTADCIARAKKAGIVVLEVSA